MPEIKNTFLKGRMNQDMDSRILPQGEYREAVNLLISRSEAATVGEFENILGNLQVGTISSTAHVVVIGHTVDETNNRVYVFGTTFSNSDSASRATSAETCMIVEFDLSNPGSPTTLVSGYWLNFNQKFPIHGVNLIENLLFWTDNFNQPRRINITTAGNNPSAYTTEVQISVAKYYPWNPLIPMARTTGTIAATTTATTLVVSYPLPSVRVGDIVMDHNKGPGVTELVPTLVKVIKINSTTSFEVSPSIGSVLATGFKVDFSRTTMENHSDQYMSNYSQQILEDVSAKPNTAPSTVSSYNPNGWQYLDLRSESTYGISLGGIPKIGDLVSKTPGPTDIPSDLRIKDVVIVSGTTTKGVTSWQIYFDQDPTGGSYTGFSDSGDPADTVTFGDNPLYEAAYPGDPSFLDDKFVRFSYRFKFDDNEYSLMAPFSQIMFIPKQYGEFGSGQIDQTETIRVSTFAATYNNYYQDEEDAYTSTILQWFENDVDTIGLKIPLPTSLSNLQSIYNVKAIEVLYKESDALSVKVLDSITTNSITESGAASSISLYAAGSGYTAGVEAVVNYGNIYTGVANTAASGLTITITGTGAITGGTITTNGSQYKDGDIVTCDTTGSNGRFIVYVDSSTISLVEYDDSVNGLIDQYYWDYDYKSTKPYKTLTEGQTTRVYDKVPVKALGQELISNRVVYGNIVERMTPPKSIAYSAGTNNRNTVEDLYTQYPYHTVKQNRTYQIGFVLADYFGRQSDVILSSYDDTKTLPGSSVYLPYNTLGDNTNTKIIDWIGKALTVTLDEQFANSPNTAIGEPGLYREEGWVSSVLLITDADDGYVTGVTYNTIGGTGSGCTVRVNAIIGTGEIDGLTIITAGSGYTQGDELRVDGGDGAGDFTVNVGEANPLGWYTYKIVIKQQEQEYYNVYVPGFINGLPIQDRLSNARGGLKPNAGAVSTNPTIPKTYRNKLALATLIGDNINKIPRNLKEVGPTDEEFNSDEILYIRINNPDVLQNVTNYPPVAYNQQYYPGTASQNVQNISTVRESQYAAIPFVAWGSGNTAYMVPYGNQGEYNSTVGVDSTGAIIVDGSPDPEDTKKILQYKPTGAIPHGDVSSVPSFYGSDQNPFIVSFSTSANSGNPVGAIVAGSIDSGYTGSEGGAVAMMPILSIAETKPVFSLLDIYWETTMCGKIETLNSSIVAEYGGIIGITTASTASFAESVTDSANIGTAFKFINGSGAEVSGGIDSVTITQIVKQNEPSTDVKELFGLDSSGSPEFQIQTNSYFWYITTTGATPSSGVYIVSLNVISGGNAYNDDLPAVLTFNLTNVAPVMYHTAIDAGNVISTPAYTLASNPLVGDTTIVQLYGTNGTNILNTDNYEAELAWSIASVLPASETAFFSIDSTGLITTSKTMINEQEYTVYVNLADVQGTGAGFLSIAKGITFTAGTAYAPKVICNGPIGGSAAKMPVPPGANVSQAEYLLAEDNTTTTATSTSNPFGLTPTFFYNSQRAYNSLGPQDGASCYPTSVSTTCCQGGLFQGRIEIITYLEVDTTVAGDASIQIAIQYRTGPGNPWTEIDSISPTPSLYNTYNASAYPTYPQLDLNTNQAPGVNVYYKYIFDQLGDYRVVTSSQTGDGATAAQFYVDFGDGTYSSGACTGSNNPCNP